LGAFGDVNGGSNISNQVTFAKNNHNVILAGGNLSAESFVCLGHCNSNDFWDTLEGLIIKAAVDQDIGTAIINAVGVAITDSAAITAAGNNPNVIAAAGANPLSTVVGGAAVLAQATATIASNAIIEFKDLVAQMLSLIRVNNKSLSVANDNLPTIA
jgi:hypothetical protein